MVLWKGSAVVWDSILSQSYNGMVQLLDSCLMNKWMAYIPDCFFTSHIQPGGPVNTLRPRQDGCHFPDDIFKCIFLNENAWILFTISLNFVPKGPINNIPSSVQIMAWRRSGNKPFSGPMMALFTDAYVRHSASMSWKIFETFILRRH